MADYGYNATIGSDGYGKRRIRVLSLGLRMSMIANQDEAKNHRALYPVVTTSSSFDMTMVFVSFAERERFNKWMSTYMSLVASNAAKSGVMTVSVPSRDFLKTCVPEGDLGYGEAVTDVGYELTMPFVGASDTIDLDVGARMAGVSYFKSPVNKQTSQYFYPAGRQVKGAESLDGTIFDSPPLSGTETPADADYGDPNDPRLY